MSAELLRLRCRACGPGGWLPDRGVTMGVVKAHYETEHCAGGEGAEDVEVALDLVCVCPRDGVECPLVQVVQKAGGREQHVFECPECRRTYRAAAGRGSAGPG